MRQRLLVSVYILWTSVAAVSGNRAVLAFVDGAGMGHAAFGGLPTDSMRWARGAVATPAGDTALVASMLSTGCEDLKEGGVSAFRNDVFADKLHESFHRKGGSFALVTSKCVDDGTTSPFVTSWGDRYDLSGVSGRISVKRPQPSLLAGGFSSTLWQAAAENGSSFLRFDSDASTTFAETCEYPPNDKFASRVADALDQALEKDDGGGFLLVLVFTGVDAASHKGYGVASALGVVKSTLTDTENKLVEYGGAWRMVVVGSHDTGGFSSEGVAKHRKHSDPGTMVPIFTRGVSASDLAASTHMWDVARLLEPSHRCLRERDNMYVGAEQRARAKQHRHRTRDGHRTREGRGDILIVAIFFAWFGVLVVCWWCV